ncbi:MAG: secondary thiamine-phosphate synthase enzyme YjbQ [Candidatus Thiodiazotropha sp.]|uniref:Secondary thiamine-phosphate synthase enzyme YjbQ n=1 Tax=Candidatus Thiodiazotropha taylori TaxID=2792791 RepID=A0A9E4TV43_9GAMM|nr:secondary thiamine-phosphate synthase enzyme YjbQ [Candidatus Thiodiazotropha taylori]MCW4238670.1 secondary thiamine-phosphate synthase enzyme YjbQ [Candidatus Thiodiazotropha endolucinida]
MSNCYKILNISTGRPFEVCDITEQVESVVRESGVLEGTVAITSLHTTCAISVNENEERLFEDIRNFFLTIASPEGSYKHNDLHLRINIPPDEPENAHAHLIAMILGNGETVPLHDGALVLGRYQSILLLEMDGPRERTYAVQVVGVS